MLKFRKSKGAALVAAIISVAIIGILGLGTTKIFSSALRTLAFTKITTQAEQYAKAQAGLVRAQNYADLASVDKTEINGTNFKYEINVGDESNYNDDIKQKNVVVSIYNKSESSSIYTLNVPRFSKEPSSGGTSGITVVETWHEGTEWYRVWSDGWIEQGGYSYAQGYKPGKEITFHKSFTSVNFTFVCSKSRGDSSGSSGVLNIYQKNNSSVFVGCQGQGGSGFSDKSYFEWYACGY